MNKKLLKEILGWQAESRKEEEQIIPNLISYLDKLNKNKDLLIEQDTHGNVYVTKGKDPLYPCIVSHLDQVHKYAPNKKIIENDGYLIAFDGAKQVGTGGDDLVGVFVCLEVLKTYDNIKVVFFVAEEVGCIGSNACDLTFFEDCQFIGQADRKGNADFINHSNGVKLFDEEFSSYVAPILVKYNYKECIGVATDAGALSKRGVNIACFNISSGYYNAHTSTEFVCIDEVEVCLNIICDIIDNTDKQFKYVRPVYTPTYNNTYKPKSNFYKNLYEAFKKSPKYVSSNKMSYAYSIAVEFFEDFIKDYDKFIDLYQPDYPYVTDQLEEYLELLTTEFNQTKIVGIPNTPNTLSNQLKMFDSDCLHKNVKFDNSMQQSYCMDCFSYIEEGEAYYDNDSLDPLKRQAGYY